MTSDASGVLTPQDVHDHYLDPSNLKLSNGDPGFAYVGAATGIVAGTMYLQKVAVKRDITINNLWVAVFTAGATVANGYLGVYSAAGTRLGVTAAQTTSFQSTGAKSVALTAGVNLIGGPGIYVWLAILVGSAGTLPQFCRGSTNFGNAGLTAAPYKFGTSGTSQTSMPASITMSSMGSSIICFWEGAS